MGISPAEVATTISELYCRQIFSWGLCIVIPPGNLLVRRRCAAGGGRQVVLLDHGLYRAIDDDFACAIRGLWRGLMLGDEAQIKEHASPRPKKRTLLSRAMMTASVGSDPRPEP